MRDVLRFCRNGTFKKSYYPAFAGTFRVSTHIISDPIGVFRLNGRPGGVFDEHVFLRSHAPYVGLSPLSDLYWVSAAAFARTATSPRNGKGQGFRVLRASFATRMLAGGAPLPVISGALGHRGIGSAKHYLAADDRHMRDCCLDFTGIEPAGAR